MFSFQYNEFNYKLIVLTGVENSSQYTKRENFHFNLIPFCDMVPPDPTFSQMRDIVCGNSLTISDDQPNQSNRNNSNINAKSPKISPDYDNVNCRPRIYQRWLDDTYLSCYAQVIQECWHDDWSVRLSALRVRKRLGQIEDAVRQSLIRKREENIPSNVNELSVLLTGDPEALA
ncbi:putative activin receptor [Schistosoma mansoni]|uniref:putative activin receptor n=1 Tax=Schistosoma mansoni TaxID=6183 RepID=UPI00019B3722|nr:putative activin receptor [Schistosoma mansoni]|eukprot:XP_018648428.1 putative activin receptor [Schistosoma mansoni]